MTTRAAAGSAATPGHADLPGVQAALTTDDPRILRALLFIDQHLDRPIHLAELAAMAAIERKYLSRLFRRETGWPCAALIRHLRLAHAEKLLREPRWTIADIAAEVGWDLRTLQRVFRKYNGLTAQAYRDSRRSPRRAASCSPRGPQGPTSPGSDIPTDTHGERAALARLKGDALSR